MTDLMYRCESKELDDVRQYIQTKASADMAKINKLYSGTFGPVVYDTVTRYYKEMCTGCYADKIVLECGAGAQGFHTCVSTISQFTREAGDKPLRYILEERTDELWTEFCTSLIDGDFSRRAIVRWFGAPRRLLREWTRIAYDPFKMGDWMQENHKGEIVRNSAPCDSD